MTGIPTRKSFFRKALIVLLGLILADICLGQLLRHYYFRVRRGEQYRLTYTLDSTRADVLVMGSSRAVHQYIPTIISDSLHASCYNAGKDLQGIFYDLAVLKAITGRYHPRTIILDLTPIAFLPEEAALNELSVLLPYYRQHPELRPILNRRSRWEWLKTCSSLYCFNSLALPIIYNGMAAADDPGVINGYIPRYDSLKHTPSPPFTIPQLVEATDTGLAMAFRDIILVARQNHCTPIVVVSPVYYPLPIGSSTIRLAGELCTQWQVPFFDFTTSAGFHYRPDLFYDELHLNDRGAALFSRMLCSELIAKGFR